MKNAIFTFFCVAYSVLSFAQSTNTFPTSGDIGIGNFPGNVGIGTLTPKVPLEVNGHGSFHGGMASDPSFNSPYYSGWFRGLTNQNANVILQGGIDPVTGYTIYPAFWLTGSNGILRIGGDGSTEPSMGVINVISYENGGSVGIGTTTAGSFKLAVEGKIGAREVQVTATNPWPDYVFKSDYELITIDSLDNYLKAQGHLPNIPSAKDIQEKGGIELGNMTTKLLEKIEELTLYLIDLKKENEEIKKQLRALSQE